VANPAAFGVPTLASEGNGQDVKADDSVKVPEIGGSDAPTDSYGGRRDEPIVRPGILTGGGELGPDAGVRTSGEEAERQRGKCLQDRFDEGFTAGPVPRGGAVRATQQLSGRDSGDPDLFVRPQLIFQASAHLGHGASRWQAADSALEADEDGGV
jgi:hypothetical protein